MIEDLVTDGIDPTAMAQITSEVLDHGYETPALVADALGAHAQRFGLRKSDGVAVLEYLLAHVQYRYRDQVLAEAAAHEGWLRHSQGTA